MPSLLREHESLRYLIDYKSFLILEKVLELGKTNSTVLVRICEYDSGSIYPRMVDLAKNGLLLRIQDKDRHISYELTVKGRMILDAMRLIKTLAENDGQKVVTA